MLSTALSNIHTWSLYFYRLSWLSSSSAIANIYTFAPHCAHIQQKCLELYALQKGKKVDGMKKEIE